MSKHYLTHFFRFFPTMYEEINEGKDIRPTFDRVSEKIVRDQIVAVTGFTSNNETLKFLHILRLFNLTRIWTLKPTDLDINRVYVSEILLMVEQTQGNYLIFYAYTDSLSKLQLASIVCRETLKDIKEYNRIIEMMK